jgi:hypothetical protein
MPPRSPAPSLFRPARRIDQSVLEENRVLLSAIDRRKVLRGGLSLGAPPAHGLRRRGASAARAAHGLGMERLGAGADVPAQSPGADVLAR